MKTGITITVLEIQKGYAEAVKNLEEINKVLDLCEMGYTDPGTLQRANATHEKCVKTLENWSILLQMQLN